MARKESGYRLLAYVGSDGRVKNILVLAGIPDGFSEKLQKAAFKLKYRPAMKDGRPVEAWDPVIGFVGSLTSIFGR